MVYHEQYVGNGRYRDVPEHTHAQYSVSRYETLAQEQETKKEWCTWCHGMTVDDEYRGHCAACGGPRDETE